MPAIDSQTPHIGVIDNRGLSVRQVAYWRRHAGEVTAQTLVTTQEHDGAGRRVAQRDPRFLAPASRPNMATVYSLSGTALCTESRDAGWRLGLPDGTGRMREHWDGRGSHWLNEYDVQRRLTAVHETTQGSTARTIERLTYADNSGEFAERNQCAQLIRHDDRAGVVWLDQQALSGAVIRQRRRFLPDQPDVQPHWPVDEAQRDALLQPGSGYLTANRIGPLGQMLEQTDAGGHRRHFGMDSAGQLQRIDLTLQSQGRQPLLKAASYNAEGQLLTQVTGNDVTSCATYEAASGRLKRMTATTSQGIRLQDQRYEYDPVGNILRLLDHTQPVSFFASQRVEAQNTYTYDSLYQLTCATGRKTANAGQPPGLPELVTPSPIDPGRLLNYTEFYEYDESGNRTDLRHVSESNPFRRQLRVDPQSNRALPWNEGDDEPDFPGHFDANGNQQYLAPGTQSMTWDALNQLHSVTSVGRPTAVDDAEGYRYDAAGQRVVKFSTQQARAVAHRRVVHYLAGVEVRTRDDDEEFQVIHVPLARGSVRCLHWVKGKPADIEADQLRYSVDDHLGSCSLELDKHAGVISHEGYYPYGGTAWWAARSKVDADYKTIRYSGKERDACGLYYYGFRYFAPWLGRWVNPDPAGAIDGLNFYTMVGNNPVIFSDPMGQCKTPIEKNIHQIWIGEEAKLLESRKDMINKNVHLADDYKVYLYLDTKNEDTYSELIKDLNVEDVIHSGTDDTIFSSFQNSQTATIYNDFRSAGPKNYAFAGDILRPYIVEQKGGLYLDVGMQLFGTEDKNQHSLGGTTLLAGPDEVLTSTPVTMEWEDPNTFASLQINNSAFAAHSGNAVLKDVMLEMTRRYDETIRSNADSTRGHLALYYNYSEPTSRAKSMTYITGPRIFTDVIMKHDNEIETILSELHSALTGDGTVTQQWMDNLHSKMPLDRYMTQHRLNSWAI